MREVHNLFNSFEASRSTSSFFTLSSFFIPGDITQMHLPVGMQKLNLSGGGHRMAITGT